MKIIISNTVTLNGGDAAILFALDRTLRRAFGDDIEVTVFDSQAEIAEGYYEYNFQTLMWESIRGFLAGWRRKRAMQSLMNGKRVAALEGALKQYEDADLVVSTGGTYLVEHYDLGHRWMDFEAARLSETPLFFFTQSLGPFHDPVNISQVKRAFGAAPLVLLRDGKSRTHLEEHGIIRDKLHVQADGVFILADLEILEKAKKRTITEPKTAAISVRAWTHFSGRTTEEGMDHYRQSIAACAEYLVGQGFKVTFVSTCQGIPEYWTNDALTAHEIYDEIPEAIKPSLVVDEGFRSPMELQQMYGGFDLVVATRMHAAILALTAGTPVFPIAYEFKTKELFERLGVSGFTQDIDTITPESAVSSMNEFVNSVDEWRGELMDAVKAEYESACVSADLIRDAYQSLSS